MNILLAEDEEIVLQYYAKLLKQKNHKVFTFEDGQSALNFFKQNPQSIDLIISDHSMIYLNGDELFYRIKEIAPNLPFILATGLDETNKIFLKLKAAGALIIVKPLRPEQILEIINQLKINN